MQHREHIFTAGKIATGKGITKHHAFQHRAWECRISGRWPRLRLRLNGVDDFWGEEVIKN